MKTNKQIHNFIKKYTRNFNKVYCFGLCVDTAEEITHYINDYENMQEWQLFNITNKPQYNNLHLIIPNELAGTFPPLQDWEDADFFHIVVKYNNLFWDGSGSHKSLKSISNKYSQCTNPHWFHT